MKRLLDLLNRWLVPFLTAVGDNPYMAAIRNGMVSVAPLTILGGLFTAVVDLPIPGWEDRVAPYVPLLQIPVTATFGLLAVFVCFAIAYELAKQFQLDPSTSGLMATLVFLMIQVRREDQTLGMEGLGSQGLFTAILISLVCVVIQRAFNRANLVIRLPRSVPPVVYESFVSLTPMIFLVVVFWAIRFGAGLDINAGVQRTFSPLLIALNTLPGILVFAFLVTLLWSVGINGDNTLDAVVGGGVPAVPRRQCGGRRKGPADALHHGARVLYDIRQRGRDRGDDRPRLGDVELPRSRVPEDQPAVVADPDLPDQRTDLLRVPNRAEPGLHGALHRLRPGPDHLQLPAHGLGADPASSCERAVDHPANHRAFLRLGWRLAGGGLGCGVDPARDGDILSVRTCGRTNGRPQTEHGRVE